MPSWIQLIVAAFAFPAMAAECPKLSPVMPGKMQMTVNPTLPPQEFVNEKGELLGLNVDLTTEIARRLCLEPVFIRMDSQGMLPGLKAGRFDMVNNGLFWTKERAQLYVMVPFAQQGFSILTRPDSPLTIKGFDDLAGLRVATELGSYPDRMARLDADALAKRGGKPVQVLGFANGSESLAALRAGQIDAILTINETAASLAGRGLVKVQATDLWHSEITFTFLDRAMGQATADALTALRAEGVYDTLFDKWGMARISNLRFAIRTAED